MSIFCKELISSSQIALLLQQRYLLYVGRADNIVCRLYIVVFCMQNGIFCIDIYLVSIFSKSVISAMEEKKLLLYLQNLNSLRYYEYVFSICSTF